MQVEEEINLGNFGQVLEIRLVNTKDACHAGNQVFHTGEK